MPSASARSSSTNNRRMDVPVRLESLCSIQRRCVGLFQSFVDIVEQFTGFAAATGIGNCASGPIGGCPALFQRAAGFGVAVLVDQETGVKVVRVDALWVDCQGLAEQFGGLVIVTEADRPAGHLIVETGEAGVGGTVERLRIECQRLLEACLGLLGQAECAEPTLGAGPGAANDAVPDQQFGCIGLASQGLFGLAGEFGECRFALRRRQLIVDFGPALLQLLQRRLAGGVEGEAWLAAQRQQREANAEQGFHGVSPWEGLMAGGSSASVSVGRRAKRLITGSCLRSAWSTRRGSKLLRRTKSFSGQPR